MSLKISANQSAVAYHIIDGAFTFPYAVDAIAAVKRFPQEWSEEPWPKETAVEQPDSPAPKRPFGRKGELTAAEKKMIDDKATEDRMAASGAKITA